MQGTYAYEEDKGRDDDDDEEVASPKCSTKARPINGSTDANGTRPPHTTWLRPGIEKGRT